MISHPNKSPEQILWQSVVLRALMDATGNKETERTEADAWIRFGGKKFQAVVTMAGMCPDFVRDAYIAGRVNPDLLRSLEDKQ
jgi:hypothetical protein